MRVSGESFEILLPMSMSIPSLCDLRNLRAPLKLKGVVKNNAWGKKGAQSRIAKFVAGYAPETPLAEYWLGTHVSGSAQVVLPDGSVWSLRDVFRSDESLPYMVKILSIDESYGLSIQSHPDAAMAKLLHERSPEHYPDSSHKPEIGVALSSVEILYGFKTLGEIRTKLVQFPILKEVFGGDLLVQLEDCTDGHNEDLLKALFASLFEVDSSVIIRVVSEILANRAQHSTETVVIDRLADVHGLHDPGLLAVMLMNVVTLSKGEAIFMAPNVPHAYLLGDVLECMTCSDNVIRAGLTSKYKDVATLLETCSYSLAGKPQLVPSFVDASGISTYDVPVDDFQLGVISAGQDVLLGETKKHTVIWSLEGECSVCQCDSGATVKLGDGESVFLPAGSGSYRCTCMTGQAFIAC